jgi:hypothetical protein
VTVARNRAGAVGNRLLGALLVRSGRQIRMPRRWIEPEECALRYGGTWHLAYAAAGRVSRTPPVQYGPRTADFESPVDPVPALGVLELPRGYVVGREGWIVSREGYLLPRHAWTGINVDEMQRNMPRRRQRVVRLKGTVLSIATRSADANYGHFLLDGIGRLALVEKAGLSLAEVDHFYCAVPFERSKQLLERAGVRLDRCVWAQDGVAVQAERLLAPTFPGTRRNYQPWLVDFLQRALLGERPVRSRRLYVQRKETRLVINEEELLPLLVERGFEIYDPGASADSPADFAAAEIVVGPHGAGLADLAFCAPGTAVLELIPESHVMPYWYTLSEAARLRYGYLVSDWVRSTPAGRSKDDLHVDPGLFMAALDDTVKSITRSGG